MAADSKVKITDLPQEEKDKQEEAEKVVGGLMRSMDPTTIGPIRAEEKVVGLVGK